MKTNIRIKQAKQLEKQVHARVKQAKFNQLLNMQLNAIENAMSEYRGSGNFFFADTSQYRRDFEQVWKCEFVQAATRLLEAKGYRITRQGPYNLITW